uniref:tRNA (cytosine(34)-C(5))-methyltransferase, mitochondrial-like isoform X2 n=1 Tax=Oncorhynchus gorbuscha TaxID=8017 RepID=UPI001EAF7DC8|nr:tRNA (cytosine(34)-C(5))-methyltransferase, mitochondrial-like isoform X2 [Oncorhynchus gorbuscha]XP_046192501.1 tRNA (cytosine(34)-C(5))-methyltransferase, mitochondrial-like isoform X3 [Oncorhynchus gorbuscha]XP_046192502.1 tRNA (cytosine(34)-C(5))-methyltransferase, mitochondrial-like isoform X4 [Oncorhynchus gorbuscha]
MFRRLVSGELIILQWRQSQSSKCLRLLSCNSVIGSDRGQDLSREERTVPAERVHSRPEKQKRVCKVILDRFDQQYGQELGPLWPSARAVLLNPGCWQYGVMLNLLSSPPVSYRAVLLNPGCWQYGVMLNRFAVVSEVKQRLQGQGFVSLLPHTDLPLNSSLPQPHPTSPTQPSSIPHPGPHPTSPTQPSSIPHPGPHPTSPTQPSSIPHPGPPPPSLQCFIHPSPVRYPSPPHRQGQLKPYYLMNAASLLPVLALGVEEGDRVLDLCSAPGGKALAILQTADPALLCCNEMDPHRRDWLAKTLESFIPQSLSSRVTVSNQDGRIFGQSEAGMYDKVLLDAPCSNDRSWLFSGPGGEQHGAVRLRERARLPTLQTQLLRSALAAVRPGGVAVYSTCTLSRSENQEVVEAVLNTCPGVELQDLEEELALPLQEHFTFTPLGHTPSLGLLVVPQQGQTWGPMFLSRIKRIH